MKALPLRDIDRIEADFDIDLVDGTGTDEQWPPYDTYTFDQTPKDPPSGIRTETREVARRLAVLLRDTVGYLGGFNVDGVSDGAGGSDRA